MTNGRGEVLKGSAQLRAGFFIFLVVMVLFGAWLFLRQIVERGSHVNERISMPGGVVEWLTVGDPFAMILDNVHGESAERIGIPLRLSIRRYARTFDEIMLNHRDQSSFYHLVSFDVLWLPALVEAHVLSPLNQLELEGMGLNEADGFFPITLSVNRVDGTLYGLPIQPHAELLWYRKDLLEAGNFQAPRTFDELLKLARHFHRPEERLYGVCWNALRGQALGQTVAHLYAAFGGALLSKDGKVTINSATGRDVLAFMQELMEVSPPDILTMAWDQRIDRFARGQAVFTYGWTARASMVEDNPLSKVAGKVGYTAPPVAEVGIAGVPFGQWSMGIPANLPAAERELALRAMAGLLSEQTYNLFASNGLVGLHRRQLGDPVETPAYRAVVDILEQGLVNLDARPSVPQWTELAETVGTIFHDVLLGKLSDEAALETAQLSVEQLMADRGGALLR